MFDSYGIVRLVIRYERLFERKFEKIRDNKESMYLGIGKEKLKKLLNRLLVLSAFG